eukprot:PLAT9507.1.p1 GENE.PLAT9507.1~~PLAT9507.1.p1  ORF type:complete len:417 (-),score=142.94 PLAT9507.1:206-1456(-)
MSGERGLAVKADMNKHSWESSDFPVLCTSCLGDSPRLRMVRESFGAACKICSRPYTVFRWRPNRRAASRKTEVCQTCAKMKNVCQSCVLDLEYGLPVPVRDTFLAEHKRRIVASGETNREYQAQVERARLAREGRGDGKAEEYSQLASMARSTPYYMAGAKGKTKLGIAHAPVAKAVMRHMRSRRELKPPSEGENSTLWLGGLQDTLSEEDITSVFAAFGGIRSLRINPRKKCAFVEFHSRPAAESAAAKLGRSVSIKGVDCQLAWATSRRRGAAGGGAAAVAASGAAVGYATYAPSAAPAAAPSAAAAGGGSAPPAAAWAAAAVPPAAVAMAEAAEADGAVEKRDAERDDRDRSRPAAAAVAAAAPPVAPAAAAAAVGSVPMMAMLPPPPGAAAIGSVLYPSMDPARLGSRHRAT